MRRRLPKFLISSTKREPKILEVLGIVDSWNSLKILSFNDPFSSSFLDFANASASLDPFFTWKVSGTVPNQTYLDMSPLLFVLPPRLCPHQFLPSLNRPVRLVCSSV